MDKIRNPFSPGAGSPPPELAGESKSYAERLFNFPAVGPLPEPDAARALQDPVQAEGVSFDLDALHEIFRLTHGYPYFLQEWGYQAWNHAAASPIDADVIRETSELVSQRLDENFFRVRLDRLATQAREQIARQPLGRYWGHEAGAKHLPQRRLHELLTPPSSPALQGAERHLERLAQPRRRGVLLGMPGRTQHHQQAQIHAPAEETHRHRSSAPAATAAAEAQP